MMKQEKKQLIKGLGRLKNILRGREENLGEEQQRKSEYRYKTSASTVLCQ
jgi:hypothetical protein